MLTGIELPPDVLTPADERALSIIQPALVKTRHTESWYLHRIAALLPDVQFLSRPGAEGYYAQTIVEEYEWALEGFATAGLLHRWIGHELSNEPNHQNGPFSYQGHYLYAAELAEALHRIGGGATLIVPGLQPYWNVADWALMLNERRPRFRWTGAHCYWQSGHLLSGLVNAVDQAGNARPSDVIVTEFGQAPPEIIGRQNRDTQLEYARNTEQERAAACVQAIQEGQARGWAAMVLFTLRAEHFGAFEFEPETARDILHSIAGTLAPEPERIPTVEVPAMRIDNRTEAQMFFRWAIARIDQDEDPYDLGAFQAHLIAIKADAGSPYRYGFPRPSLAVPKAPANGI